MQNVDLNRIPAPTVQAAARFVAAMTAAGATSPTPEQLYAAYEAACFVSDPGYAHLIPAGSFAAIVAASAGVHPSPVLQLQNGTM